MAQPDDDPTSTPQVDAANPSARSVDDELEKLEEAIRREDTVAAATLYGRNLKTIRERCGHQRMAASVTACRSSTRTQSNGR